MHILWTQEALNQLAAIQDHISKDSPEQAERFLDQLMERAESLVEQPNKGRVVPEIGNPVIRELIFKRYRIVHRVNQDCIEILTVFEGHHLLRLDQHDF